MKKEPYLTTLLLAVCLLLTACEKVPTDIEQTAAHEKGANVRLSVADYETFANDVRGTASIAQACTRLHFVIYQDDVRKKTVTQTIDDDDFGQVDLSLDEGDYELLILAHSGIRNPTMTHATSIEFTNASASNGTGFTDTFYYYDYLTVTDEPVERSFTLKRATAMFRFTTTDSKPEKVKKFQFYYEGGSRKLNAYTGYGEGNAKQSVFFDTGTDLDGKTLQFDLFTFLQDETGDMEFLVKAFDKDDIVIYEREFKNVPMQRNTITNYVGEYFTAPPEEPDTPDTPSTPSTPDTPDTPDEPKGPQAPVWSLDVDTEWAETRIYNF